MVLVPRGEEDGWEEVQPLAAKPSAAVEDPLAASIARRAEEMGKSLAQDGALRRRVGLDAAPAAEESREALNASLRSTCDGLRREIAELKAARASLADREAFFEDTYKVPPMRDSEVDDGEEEPDLALHEKVALGVGAVALVGLGGALIAGRFAAVGALAVGAAVGVLASEAAGAARGEAAAGAARRARPEKEACTL